MKRKLFRRLLIAGLILVTCLPVLSSCGRAKKTAIKALIIPKFEVGEISGDFPGEAQLFYEKYCAGCEETAVPNMPATSQFYVNKKDGVGLLVTDSGKTAASLALSAVLSCGDYDYSQTVIISVGCAGGSFGTCTLGDVILVTAACDYDLGHTVDSRNMENPNAPVTWFHDQSFDEYTCKFFNAELAETAFEMMKDCPLQTTETSKRVLGANYPGEDWTEREPRVMKGTAVTGDNFWKGSVGHANAEAIVSYYGCPDPYAVTEMEETAIANTAVCFGMLDRIVSVRVVVNLDDFLEGETPENLWSESMSYNDKVQGENSETLDIFEPAMQNLTDAAGIVIDAVLDGRIKP